jgi:hypothetical protein
MPYRIDIRCAADVDNHFDRLVELGALDVEASSDHGLSALMPERVTPDHVASALGVDEIVVSPADRRDNGSVRVLTPRPFRVGSLRITPADPTARPETSDSSTRQRSGRDYIRRPPCASNCWTRSFGPLSPMVCSTWRWSSPTSWTALVLRASW